MKVVITQSNYIPWKGYFNAIDTADAFVFLDNVQYTKRDWRNRNKIKTPNGTKWLSIPVQVSGKYSQLIKDTKIVDPKWVDNHLSLFRENYKSAPNFKNGYEFIESVYCSLDSINLSDINQTIIRKIMAYFGINTPIYHASDFQTSQNSSERLLNICKALGATDYCSGPAAKNYLNESIFEDNKVKVHYFENHKYPKYDQLHGEFDHYLSILDLIFNVKENYKFYLKN
jgi:hypothetical protein